MKNVNYKVNFNKVNISDAICSVCSAVFVCVFIYYLSMHISLARNYLTVSLCKRT